MPAYYHGLIEDFQVQSPTQILGILAESNAASFFLQLSDAVDVWVKTIKILQREFRLLLESKPQCGQWGLVLEFPIPRRQKRIDAILLAGPTIFVLEFKTGRIDGEATQQLLDYVRDLRDFHLPSKKLAIRPMAVTTARSDFKEQDFLAPVAHCRADQICECLMANLTGTSTSSAEELQGWISGEYRPVPTIIEATQAIFAGMEVREIAHAQGDPKNLTDTIERVIEQIRNSLKSEERTICFVTGIPGAGKTLAGLRLVHDPAMKEFGGSQATFLSGNGPLVAVLREALARDYSQRLKTAKLRSRPTLGKKRYKSPSGPVPRIVEEVIQIPAQEMDAQRKKEIDRRVRTLIESVHVFAKHYWEDSPEEVPNNTAIIFDEAQRAWNEKRNAEKFERPVSEPEMLLSIMERHRGAVIVALVGGGQEINDGEAGLSEWGRALLKHNSWQIVASPYVFNKGIDDRFKLADDANDFQGRVVLDPALHLKTATRSRSAEYICDWVDAVLAGNAQEAMRLAALLEDRPKITRSLAQARQWLKKSCEGLERSGLVGSANAKRLRADGLEPSYEFHSNYKWPLWFLNPAEDVRSSCKLEVFATQFEIQGLELDWVGVCWSDDFTWSGTRWVTRDFNYYEWSENDDLLQNKYRLNGHRVLLTRARKGMVIVVPSPESDDATRLHSELERTAGFFESCGAEII